ncbi:hypothetical protein OIN60_16915 [Paenibacillus sp. P96]|uniref:ATPase n=1 Tax=Paenibacillus zeirhizosphaerae TaxID=2987519 RepID=A0ABT9FUM7_9BACL|nr:hypothetical protein [Paenibacillus sp. P96]MDP4098416.1 hypothetical protein [Paenibacillus sp. P96]
MDVNVWMEFLKQNWLVILISLIVLFAVLNLVKTLVKWLIAAVIVAALLIYSGISMEQISTMVTNVRDEAVDVVRTEALNMMVKEAKDAKYESGGDGTYTVSSSNIEVKGQSGSDKVEVWFRGVRVGEWSITEAVGDYIQSAKNRSAVQ